MRQKRLDKYNQKGKFNKKIFKIIITIIVIIGIFAIIGLFLGQKKASKAPTNSNLKPNIVDTDTSKTKDVKIYVCKKDGSYTEKKVRVIDNKDFLNNKLDVLIKLLISQSILPKNTHIIGKVTVKDQIATINFSKEILDFSNSYEGEAIILNSIAKTLCNKDILSIQILVGGEKIDSLGGHIELNEPYSL